MVDTNLNAIGTQFTCLGNICVGKHMEAKQSQWFNPTVIVNDFSKRNLDFQLQIKPGQL